MPRTAKVKKSEPKTQSNGNGIAALTAQLWQAAVNLRGSMAVCGVAGERCALGDDYSNRRD
jgi:hypothetical protein